MKTEIIKQVNRQSDFTALAQLLNQAFATVAKEFGLTKENSPTNNAFINGEQLKSQLTHNREFYVYKENTQCIGFIAIEQALNTPGTFYIEKLAVSPDYRHAGIGIKLMNFASERIKQLGGKYISIGLIDSNIVLKNWYQKQGFSVIEIKKFPHLPFDVCIMEKEILSLSI